VTTTSDAIRAEITALVKEGRAAVGKREIELKKGGAKRTLTVPDVDKYQRWYTKALPVVRQILPDRYEEFRAHYSQEKRKAMDLETYTISDLFSGLAPSSWDEDVPINRAVLRVNSQIRILESALGRLDSKLSDITLTLESELFEHEIDAADVLLKSKYVRAAGALAGVALERHLGTVARSHDLKVAKKDPTIAELNDPLKAADVIDVPTWRFIQRLADLRNLCDHAKQRDPTNDEVQELIAGVRRIVKTVS